MSTRTDRVQVVFEVGGDGKLKATMVDIGKSADGAALGLDRASGGVDRLIGAARTGATILGTGFVAGLALVVRNTMQAEQEVAQLEAILKSTGGAAGKTKQQLLELASALASKSTFSAGEIVEAETRLLSYSGVIGENIPRAMQAIIDQSARLGISLTQSAETIGRALESPTKAAAALAQQGFGAAFTDSVRKNIKDLEDAGRTAEAQAVILGILEESYAGAAEAARNTFGGALQALKNTLMDVTTGSDGSLDDATAAVNELTAALNDPDVQAGLATIVSGFTQTVTWAAKAAAEVANATGALREYFGEASKKSTISLQNQRQELETQLFGEQRAQRRSWLGAAVEENAPRVKELKAQIAEIDTLLAKRRAEAIANGPAASPTARFSADYERTSLNFNPNPKATGKKKKTGKAGRSREMPDFYADTVEDIKREIEQAARLDDEWNQLAATLAGPLAEAEYRHQQNLREIETLGKKTGRSAQQVKQLKDQETAAYEKQRKQIEESLNPMAQLLEAYQLEISLMGAGNAERAMANELRRKGIDLASAEAQAYLEQARATDEQARVAADALGYAQDAKGVAHNFLMDLSKDAAGTFKNIGDYWEDLVDRMLSRWFEAGLDGLFSGKGFSGFGGTGGGAGGFLGGLMSLFGGGAGGGATAAAGTGSGMVGWIGAGYANGGIHGPNGPIPLRTYASGGVARSPEMVMIGEGRKPEAYVPLPDGRRIPVAMEGGYGGGPSYTIINQIRGDVNARTSDQLSTRLAEKLQRAGRNR